MVEAIYSAEALRSSRNFRVLLDAMAKPGHVFDFAPKNLDVAPLYATTIAIAHTLFDFQSPIWLSPAFAQDGVIRHLKFHTGAPRVEKGRDAAFAVLSARDGIPALHTFAQGTHEYPDRSTTLIIQVDGFSGDMVRLSGPGLKQPGNFGADHLTRAFWDEMIENNRSFPLGIDVIFSSPNSIACCPRSTRIAVKDMA
jgi:alpha-D-ribose 1-methylphosphonate 5-triphosphate synthase subunit PhnH